ncbi:MAG TPA: T9SS type A sorting domain-containing protein, partial [Ignavibacteria bacterium]|nr:T9SS type A sorting domain-containing protein [Ignavibacteria bacterium]
YVQPINIKLYQNYPNPFNPSTKINYELRSALGGTNFVSLKVYDILGNKIIALVNEYKTAGSYDITFSATEEGLNLPSGVYFYSLEIDDIVVDSKKLLLLK